MRDFSISPSEILASFWRNRGLIGASVKREVLGRYRGSFLGILWSFFHPLFMLVIYTFVFSVIFKSRWPGGSDSKTEFALVLFAGLIVFNLFSECINRAPGLIVGNVNYVKKVVYPLEILPWVAFGASLFHGAVSLGVWILAYVLLIGPPHVTILLFPLTLIPLTLLIMGMSWALASLGVYLRDIAQFIGLVTTVLMFLSPIFYPVTSIPQPYRELIYFNPLTPVIEQTRSTLFAGTLPDFARLSIYFVVSALIAWLGFAFFQKTRKGFADVL